MNCEAGKEYCIAKDDDGHSYIILLGELDDFHRMLDDTAGYSDAAYEAQDKFDDRFSDNRIDGGVVVFKEWRFA